MVINVYFRTIKKGKHCLFVDVDEVTDVIITYMLLFSLFMTNLNFSCFPSLPPLFMEYD